MPVFNFQLTGNEETMLTTAFPETIDIGLVHEKRSSDIKSGGEAFYELYKFKVPVVKLIKTALQYTKSPLIKPHNFFRKMDRNSKTTTFSDNWPSSDWKHSVRLSDEEMSQLEQAASYFAGNKTYAIVWVIRNFTAMLAEDHSLLTSTHTASRLTDVNSRKVNVRLDNDVAKYYDSIRGADSLGKVIREVIYRDYERQTSSQTDEQFDFDLDKE